MYVRRMGCDRLSQSVTLRDTTVRQAGIPGTHIPDTLPEPAAYKLLET